MMAAPAPIPLTPFGAKLGVCHSSRAGEFQPHEQEQEDDAHLDRHHHGVHPRRFPRPDHEQERDDPDDGERRQIEDDRDGTEVRGGRHEGLVVQRRAQVR